MRRVPRRSRAVLALVAALCLAVAPAAAAETHTISVEMLYIDPDECIDCDACVEACPVDACFAEDQLPAEWAKYAEINAEYYKSKSAA